VPGIMSFIRVFLSLTSCLTVSCIGPACYARWCFYSMSQGHIWGFVVEAKYSCAIRRLKLPAARRLS